MIKRRKPLTGSFRAGELPDGHSALENHVYDLLLGGELTAAERLDDNVFQDLAPSLSELLRSDAPLPIPLRLALANVIDGLGDPPVRLVMKVNRRPQAWRVLDDLLKEERALAAYEGAVESGEKSDAALNAASRASGVNHRDVVGYLASARARHTRIEQVKSARAAGKSVDEIADLISLPMPKPRRGRLPRRSRENTTY